MVAVEAEMRCDVAVIGGGLGGLALAAGLHRRGYDVKLFESAPELRTATGTLIGLGANGFTCLGDIHPDIGPMLKSRSSLSLSRTACIKTSKEAEPQSTTFPVMTEFHMLRWSEVQDVLASLVPADIVHTGYRVTGYTEAQDGGLARVHFKDKADVHARLVIGADGLRSALRKAMVPQDPGPRYLGSMNWNALIHNHAGAVVDAHKPGETTAFYNQVPFRKELWTVMALVIDAGPDNSGGSYTFWNVGIHSDVPAFTSSDTSEGVGAQPHLSGAGMGKAGIKARVEQILEGCGYDHVLNVVKGTSEASIFERGMYDRVPLDELGARMTSPGGRVLLLGDAAHGMHTAPGQGAQTAFEDGHTLMSLLDQHRKDLVGWAAAPNNAAETATRDESVVAPKTPEQPTGEITPETDAAPHVGPDLEVLSKVLDGYNHARLARTCRIQRLAAESSGLDSIRSAVRPEGLGPDEMRTRGTEFFKWLCQYPKNPTGDPESTYWKPEEQRKTEP